MATPFTDGEVGGIPFTVLIDPFDYRIDQDGPHRTIAYKVDGTKGARFCNALKGISEYGAAIKAPAPHRYWNNPNLLCFSAGLAKLLGPARPSEFGVEADEVAIVAEYNAPYWDANGTDFRDFLGADRPIPWSKASMKAGHEDYSASGIALDDGATAKTVRVKLPVMTYRFERTMIPAPLPYKTILSGLVRKVNDATFFNEARGTVYFESFEMDEQDRDPSGDRVFTFASMFSWRPLDWNKQLSPNTTNSWVYPADTADYTYEYADFRNILYYGLG